MLSYEGKSAGIERGIDLHSHLGQGVDGVQGVSRDLDDVPNSASSDFFTYHRQAS